MEKLLTAKQVGELLEVKISTVYDWVARGVIPYVKLGRLLRFKKNEIFRWVETHTLRPKEFRVRGKSVRAVVQKEFPLV